MTYVMGRPFRRVFGLICSCGLGLCRGCALFQLGDAYEQKLTSGQGTNACLSEFVRSGGVF